MKTYVQPGGTLTVTAPYAVLSGGGVLVGNLFGIAAGDIANGAQGEILTEGVVEIAKTQALAIAAGDRVFWDDVNKVVNKTAAAQVCVGVAVEAAANPSDTVKIKLAGVCLTPAGT